MKALISLAEKADIPVGKIEFFPFIVRVQKKLMVFFQQKFWCIHNLNLNKILIACKFTVCKLENSQSETYNSIYSLVHDYESTASLSFYGLLIGQEGLCFV